MYTLSPTLQLQKTRTSILQRIADRGGLLGYSALLYMNDEDKANDFIAECFGQCRNRMLWDHWGAELVLDLIHYRLAFLKYRFGQLFEVTDKKVVADLNPEVRRIQR